METTLGWDSRLGFESHLHRILFETLGGGEPLLSQREGSGWLMENKMYFFIHLVTFSYLSMVGENKLL